MEQQPWFWFVHARVHDQPVNLAVAAFTERSARMQARKRLGSDAKILEVSQVRYAHAWVIHHGWYTTRQDHAVHASV